MANFIDLTHEGSEHRRDAPSNHLVRIRRQLVTLLGDGVLDCAVCVDRFSILQCQLPRDILSLKEIGKILGLDFERKQHCYGRLNRAFTWRPKCDGNSFVCSHHLANYRSLRSSIPQNQTCTTLQMVAGLETCSRCPKSNDMIEVFCLSRSF